jgi:hypothetical protein
MFGQDEGLESVQFGLIEVRGLRWDDAGMEGGRTGWMATLLADAAVRSDSLVPEGRKAAVRGMLRWGKYRPAGRGKPSSEYLLQALKEDDFPSVNPFVDAVNVESLLCGYPMSILDADKAGAELLIRRGKPGERYVFNAGGQEIDVADLLCVCRKDGQEYIASANPVRDSMVTKLFPGAGNAVVIVYAPAGSEGGDIEAVCERLAGRLAVLSDHIVNPSVHRYHRDNADARFDGRKSQDRG